MESILTTDAHLMNSEQTRPSLIQHQLRPEVHAWIKDEARKIERSQRWFANKLIEEAYSRAKHGSLAATQPQGAQQLTPNF